MHGYKPVRRFQVKINIDEIDNGIIQQDCATSSTAGADTCGIATDKNNNAYFFKSFDGRDGITESYYTIKNSQWVNVLSGESCDTGHWLYDNEPVYYVNGSLTNKQTYDSNSSEIVLNIVESYCFAGVFSDFIEPKACDILAELEAMAVPDEIPIVSTVPEISVLVNNKKINFDQPPENLNGRIMVPIRYVVEEMGCTVEWEDWSQTVYINSPGYDSPGNSLSEEHRTPLRNKCMC